MSKSIIYSVINRFKADKTLKTLTENWQASKREDRMIVKISLKYRFDTATSIPRAFYEQTGKPISIKTVSRRLNKETLVARILCRKPLIYATEHTLEAEEQWNMVHFSDESKFNLFGSDGKRFVRRKNGERLSPQCVKKTVKFGGGA